MHYSPIKFKPIFKQRIWGSDRLKRLFNKDLPPDELIGESWELAYLPDDKSKIAEGPMAGMDIRQLLDEHGTALGFTDEQCKFPFGLLIKFLDANDVLSVQVHPDNKTSRMFTGARHKTECWYVLEAEPNSVIYRGLKPQVNREKLTESLNEGNVEKLMNVYPARKGDFHFLPAGTIHALGAGVVIAEIQTPSDTTYRLYDWNRKDNRGRSRELHIEQALASIHYSNSADPPTDNNIIGLSAVASTLINIGNSLGKTKLLVECPYFSVVHISYESGLREFSSGIPCVMIPLSGNGDIYNKDDLDRHLEYNAGDTMLIPAIRAGGLNARQAGELLLVCLGHTPPLKSKAD